MSGSLRIASVFGIPVYLHLSWFFIFGLVALALSTGYYPDAYPAWPTAMHWIVGVITALLFFGSVVSHELSHSLVSRAFGVPVRSITLFIFGGVAQITEEPRSAGSEFLMALAGPLSSLALAAVFTGIAFIVGNGEPIGAMAGWLGSINFFLALFNMLPGFPLDGGRVFRSIIWAVTGDHRRATRVASLTGQGIAYIMIGGGVLYFLVDQAFDGLWIALIGWFLHNAASASFRQLTLLDQLRGVTARQIMTEECAIVAPDLSVQELVYEHIWPSGRRCFVVSDGALHGLVSLSDLSRVPRDRWADTRVSQVMVPLERLVKAGPNEDAATLLQRMDTADVNQLPVVEGNRVLGMVARDRLLRLVSTRAALRG